MSNDIKIVIDAHIKKLLEGRTKLVEAIKNAKKALVIVNKALKEEVGQ
jgi:hypothetical protein